MLTLRLFGLRDVFCIIKSIERRTTYIMNYDTLTNCNFVVNERCGLKRMFYSQNCDNGTCMWN